jgi:hypothetical protein
MTIEIEVLTTRLGELVRALDIMTDKFNAQSYELRLSNLKAQNLETALALARDERMSNQQAIRLPQLPN